MRNCFVRTCLLTSAMAMFAGGVEAMLEEPIPSGSRRVRAITLRSEGIGGTYGRPIPDLLGDINTLGSATRAQSMRDLGKELRWRSPGKDYELVKDAILNGIFDPDPAVRDSVCAHALEPLLDRVGIGSTDCVELCADLCFRLTLPLLPQSYDRNAPNFELAFSTLLKKCDPIRVHLIKTAWTLADRGPDCFLRGALSIAPSLLLFDAIPHDVRIGRLIHKALTSTDSEVRIRGLRALGRLRFVVDDAILTPYLVPDAEDPGQTKTEGCEMAAALLKRLPGLLGSTADESFTALQVVAMHSRILSLPAFAETIHGLADVAAPATARWLITDASDWDLTKRDRVADFAVSRLLALNTDNVTGLLTILEQSINRDAAVHRKIIRGLASLVTYLPDGSWDQAGLDTLDRIFRLVVDNLTQGLVPIDTASLRQDIAEICVKTGSLAAATLAAPLMVQGLAAPENTEVYRSALKAYVDISKRFQNEFFGLPNSEEFYEIMSNALRFPDSLQQHRTLTALDQFLPSRPLVSQHFRNETFFGLLRALLEHESEMDVLTHIRNLAIHLDCEDDKLRSAGVKDWLLPPPCYDGGWPSPLPPGCYRDAFYDSVFYTQTPSWSGL